MALPWRLALTRLILFFVLSTPYVAAQEADNEPSKLAFHDDTLLWGPYKPNLYFGIRPRIPLSIVSGLLWARMDNYTSVLQSFRHTCEQNEGMEGYGWEEYDIRTGGRQVIHDEGNNLDITTEFVKMPSGKHGGNWGARISGKPRDGSELPSSVVFYTSNEGSGVLELDNWFEERGYTENIKLKGETDELGEFNIEITNGPATNQHPPVSHQLYEKKPLDKTHVRTWRVPEQHVFNVKPWLFQDMKKELDAAVEAYGVDNMPMPWQTLIVEDNEFGEGNMHMVQKVFMGSFQFDILYNSASAEHSITSEELTKRIDQNSKAFKSKFDKVFAPSKPFDKSKYEKFSMNMFSNLLGGIGYFYGEHYVDRSNNPVYEEEDEHFWEETAEARAQTQPITEGPHDLFTAIPSRPFFPRGFLWDEGFHLLPILDWDPEVTMDVLVSWFNTMDNDGWIPREQILGDEARTKVPEEFRTQYPHIANPPTLFLVIDTMIDKLDEKSSTQSQKDHFTSFFKRIYPLLKRNYAWYRKTQKGDMKTFERNAFSRREGYRWRGRTLTHCLASGLDDYPRAQPPHPGELHVDLISWIGLMSRNLQRIADLVGEKNDAEEFAEHEKAIIHNIDDLHWDKEHQAYCDTTIDDYDETKSVCHKGYISLFPFITGMIKPDNPNLGAVLKLISDPEELWSPHGIRSLSKNDPHFGTDENYWRSPIWININYLVLDNLRKIATAKSSPQAKQAKEIYTKLRKNVVETIYKSWKATGFAFEQYNPDTGAGQRIQHFTGWTSLVVKIMTMPDLESKSSGHEEL